MTNNILMRNGTDAAQVIGFLMKSRTPVTRFTVRPMATARNTQRNAESGMLAADAEQAQVEHPARADEHRQPHGVQRQHRGIGPDRGRLLQPDRERSRVKPLEHLAP